MVRMNIFTFNYHAGIRTLLDAYDGCRSVTLGEDGFPELPIFISCALLTTEAQHDFEIVWVVEGLRFIVNEKKYYLDQKGIRLNNILSYDDAVAYLVKQNKGLTEGLLWKGKVSIDLNIEGDFLKYLNDKLKKHAALFVDNVINDFGNSLSFEKHLELFKEHYSIVTKTLNPKNYAVSLYELYNLIDPTRKKYTIHFYELLLALYYSDCIEISYVKNFGIKTAKTVDDSNYSAVIGVKNDLGIDNNIIRSKFGLQKYRTSYLVMPKDRSFVYENYQLKFKLPQGGDDQIDFTRAKDSRKVFEAFWHLWQKNPHGNYSREEVCEMYFKIHGVPITQRKVGIAVSNIRDKLINQKILIKDRIKWQFDRDEQVWIFRILA